MPEIDAFLDRFRTFGARPGAETYLPLFHEDATLFDSGMERPITVPEIPEHIGAILKVVVGFEMVPERWRARGDTLFIEARNQATLAGADIHWRSVYCMDLRGDRVVRGRRYYDRRQLFARLNPAIPQLALAEPEAATDLAAPAEAFSTPAELVESIEKGLEAHGFGVLGSFLREDGCLLSEARERPLARSEVASDAAAMAKALPGLAVESVGFAGDDALVFVEWKAQATIGGSAVPFGGCDRLDLAAGRVLHARRYFDTLHLASALSAAEAGAA